jgi:toxin ParE1/3/4
MRPKQYRLSDRAFRSLGEISTWTYERFGERQADKYGDQLLQRVSDIAEGTAPSRACRDVFAPDLSADLRFTRSGRHFVVFIETALEILIVDFIHQSADIGRRLEDPGP